MEIANGSSPPATSCPRPHLGSRKGFTFGLQYVSPALPLLLKMRASSAMASPIARYSEVLKLQPVKLGSGNIVAYGVGVCRKCTPGERARPCSASLHHCARARAGIVNTRAARTRACAPAKRQEGRRAYAPRRNAHLVARNRELRHVRRAVPRGQQGELVRVIERREARHEVGHALSDGQRCVAHREAGHGAVQARVGALRRNAERQRRRRGGAHGESAAHWRRRSAGGGNGGGARGFGVARLTRPALRPALRRVGDARQRDVRRENRTSRIERRRGGK